MKATESPFIRAFGRYLRDLGLPVTHQREAVAEVVFASEAHLSVDDIEGELRDRAERIGKATIYRTLDLLVRSRPMLNVSFRAMAKVVGVSRGQSVPGR